MKPSTVLKKARKLIERGWCRGFFAANAAGEQVGIRERGACRFCADGALMRAANKDDDGGYSGARSFLGREIDGGILEWNDRQRNRRPVLAAFDRAIKLAESEGK